MCNRCRSPGFELRLLLGTSPRSITDSGLVSIRAKHEQFNQLFKAELPFAAGCVTCWKKAEAEYQLLTFLAEKGGRRQMYDGPQI